MKPVRRVLVVIHDPGGTNFLVPALELLRVQGAELRIYAGAFAEARLNALGFKYQKIDSKISSQRAGEVFAAERPDVLLTGTSWNSNLEQVFRNEAAAANVPSVVGIDYWANYSPRWEEALYPLKDLPDLVCVIDEKMRTEMMAEGFPAQCLFVTGHPFLEKCGKMPAKRASAEPRKILFLSEPLRAEAAKIFEDPFSVLCDAVQDTGIETQLIFKPHPKEKIAVGFSESLKKKSVPGLDVLLWDGKGLFPEDYANFDVLIGYQTMGLFEARAMGLSVYSMALLPTSGALHAAMDAFSIPRLEIKRSQLAKAISHAAESDFPRARLYDGAAESIKRKVLLE